MAVFSESVFATAVRDVVLHTTERSEPVPVSEGFLQPEIATAVTINITNSNFFIALICYACIQTLF